MRKRAACSRAGVTSCTCQQPAHGRSPSSALGKLQLPEPAASYIPKRIATEGIRPLAITHTHALAVSELPFTVISRSGLPANESVFGVDLSLQMIGQARRLNPDISFREDDMTALGIPDDTLAKDCCKSTPVMLSEAKHLLLLIESKQKADPSLPLRMT